MLDFEEFIENYKKAALSDKPQQQVKALMEGAFNEPGALQQALDEASSGFVADGGLTAGFALEG